MAGSADLLPTDVPVPRRRRRPLLAGVGAAVAAAAVVGGLLVGGSGHHAAHLAGADIAALARGAEGKRVALKSSKVDFTMTMTVKGHDLSGGGTGAFDYVNRDGELAMTIEPIGTLNEIMTPDAMYLQLPESERAAVAAETGGRSWLEISFAAIAKQTGVDLSALMQQQGGQDPASSLRLLAQAGSFHLVGTEPVRGVMTTHYSGTVDLAAAMRQKSTDLAATNRVLKDYSSTHVPVDVWLDADGVPRRMTQTLSMKTPGTMTMSMEFYDFGAPVSVVAPPANDVYDAGQALGG
jgi:hypothetical protein